MSIIKGSKGGGKGGSGDPPRTPVEYPNTLRSKNIVRILDVLCEGPIKGLVDGNKSIFLDETPIQNEDGSVNFTGISVETREGYPDQTHIGGFPQVEKEVNVGVELSTVSKSSVQFAQTDLITLFDGSTTEAINISVGDTVRSNDGSQDVEGVVTYAQSSSTRTHSIFKSFSHRVTWPGFGVPFPGYPSFNLENGGTKTYDQIVAGDLIRIDSTTLWEVTWSRERSITTIYVSPSRQFDMNYYIRKKITLIHVDGFQNLYRNGSLSTDSNNKTITYVSRSITGSDVDALKVKVRVPQLSKVNQSNFDTEPNSVSFQIQYLSQDQSWVNISNYTISGKNTSPFERSYLINLSDLNNAETPYTIRLGKLTVDSQLQNVQNRIFWSSYTEVIDAKLTYPDTALVGITVDAQQFGSRVASRGYHIDGLLVKVPTNYDPETRGYSGIWDGTFKLEWTDNPAWCFYDLTTNPRYGAGLSNVDKWSLYEISKYCDDNVPDGKGGTEPRYTFNGVFQSQKEVYDALNTMVSSFASMIFWGTDTISINQDSPKDPVKLVTPANVIDGIFNYSGTGLKARHSVVHVTWNDPENQFKADVVVVEDEELIRRYGYNVTSVVAFGCSRESQAQRYGRWILDTVKTSDQTVSYSASFDHMDIRPGDLINIADPTYAGARYGGRIKTTGLSSLIVDSIPREILNEKYYIYVTLSDGSLVYEGVDRFENDTVYLDNDLSEEPLNGSIFVLTSNSLKPRQFKIISISEKEKNIFEVTALFHDPNKYERVENGVYLPDLNYSILPTGVIKAPTDLKINEYLFKRGLAVKSAVDFSWTAPNDPRVSYYEVEIKKPVSEDTEQIAEFEPLKFTTGFSVTYEDTNNDTYSFRVRSVSNLGRKSVWAEREFILKALKAPPSDVENFQVSVKDKNLFFEWDQVPDLDLDRYEIRYSPELQGVNWNSSQVIERPKNETAIIFGPNGTYSIKAIDTSGVYSINETLIIVNTASLINENIVEEIVEQTDWLGVKDRVTVSNNAIELEGVDTLDDWPSLAEVYSLRYGVNGLYNEGYYYASERVDMGAIFPCKINSNIVARGANISNQIQLWESLDSVFRIDGLAEGDDWNIELQIRQSDDNINFTDWKKFRIGEYTARVFEFRIYLKSEKNNITPRIEKFEITVDMPDRFESGNDLICPIEGLRIDFKEEFAVTPAIGTNIEGANGGEYANITNKSSSGFDIVIKSNNNDLPVQRVFDYIAKGYGRKIT